MTNEVKKVPQLRFPNFGGEWEEKQLGDVTKTNQGLQIAISDRKTKYEKGLYFYITNEFLRPNSQTKYYIEKPPESVVAEKSDILMTRTGNTGKVITNVEGAFHNNFFKIKYNKSIIDRLFLFELLKSPKINNKFLSLAGTSTIPDLNHSDFYSVYISFPTISEQQKISTFFSKLDRQIELEEQKLEKLKEQKKGYMQKIFSQELRFKDESGNEYPEWEEKKLFDVVKYLSSKRSSNYYSEDIIHGQYPVYDAVQEISRDTNFDIEESYISILKDGAGVGRLNLRPGKSSVIGTMGYLLPQNIDIKFLFYYLKTMNFNRFVIGSTIPHLYFKDYSKETLLIPIDKSEQIKIGSFFIKLDRIINNKAKKIKVLKQRKQGFLQKMFV
ncbi:restriction endonuclease subunit S [Mammaliicoccus lentus]|uniref:restriction endonuclease subunit S n=1 Tax=Mammaliicoccus lentus TaxID=42858 RepID=UPI002B2582C6|nr:restriction endonuclease subunit S [Mammaliicoccus lentus]WQK51564.1 restriction endonuclease subunit S [Mammaliicoccus lentus]